jgi:CheY-like chemotaxis protein
MRILIVEDEEGIASFLKAGLESEYFAVDIAEDGEKGSYLARTNEYDIIILDNMLPKKEGSEVCEDIRKSGKTTPIIMLSARSELGVKVDLLNKGADDYLTKLTRGAYCAYPRSSSKTFRTFIRNTSSRRSHHGHKETRNHTRRQRNISNKKRIHTS